MDPSFWHKIAELKLNRMHLSEKEIECESEFHMSRNDGVDVPMFVNGGNVLADEDDASGGVYGGNNDKNDGIIGCWRARGDAMNFNVKERLFEMKPNEEAKKIGAGSLGRDEYDGCRCSRKQIEHVQSVYARGFEKMEVFLLVLFSERHVCAVRVCGEEERRRGGDFVQEWEHEEQSGVHEIVAG